MPATLLAALLLIAVLQLALTHDPDLPEAMPARLPPATRISDPPPVIADPEIRRRPLFSPTRRSGGGALVTGSAAPLGGATVAGAVKARGIAHVLLKAPNGSIVTLAVGGSYLGWILVSFSEDAAIFRKGSAKIIVPYGATGGAAPANSSSEEQ